MFTKISKVVTIVSTVIVMSMLLTSCAMPGPMPVAAMPAQEAAAPAAPVVAETNELAGAGPDFALAPTTEWMQIQSGEYVWYAFNYDFDASYDPIEIRMYTVPEDGAILTIRTEEQAQKWRDDGVHEHIGCCTVQKFGVDEETKYAVWAGKLESSGKYYMVVEHAKNLTEPVAYRFEFAKAEGVSMPGALYAPVAAPQPAPVTEPPMVEGALMIEGAESGPDFAMMPVSEWVALEQGQYHWYAFDYDFDASFEAIEIHMYTEPEDSAILTIRTEEQAQKWRDDGIHEHTGCCTVQDLGNKDTDYAVWAGKLESSGRYYMVVEHAKNMAETAYYRIEFTAKEGVSFPAGLIDPRGVTAPPAAEPAAEAAPAVAPEAMKLVGMNGSGPDFALAPTAEWVEIGEGVFHWYAFHYDFDASYGPVEIRMYTEPEDGAVLTVRTEEQAQKWRDDGIHEHIGCCTVQDLGNKDTDYAVWAGKLESSGKYYIVVEHAKNVSGPVHYMFTIEGEGATY
ncbi:MAG: hypothetical protein R2911_19760 [Caldilineaceae bacterium]